MDPLTRLYTLGLHAGARIAPVFARGDGKISRSVRARGDALDRLTGWARTGRDPTRPLHWLHAPSVGEGFQARAVLEELRGLVPEAQWVFTHFSPSAEGLADRMEVDFAGYLPWDLPGNWRRLLPELRPSSVVFTKTEVWPNLEAAARAAGVPTFLIAATLPETSSRRRWPARALLRRPLAGLTGVHAIAAQDAGAFIELGARRDAVSVLGDPGIDSAARRVRSADREAPHLRPFHTERAPTFVAGSTWPAGEAHLLPALAGMRREVGRLRVVIAPHEPTPTHVKGLLERLGEDGWRTATLGEVEMRGGLGDVDAVVVDRIGVLATLYTIADVAYVGGGFGTAGLHSVLEPAAAGVPIVVGPNHRSSAAAIDLLAEGAVRGAADSAGLRTILSGWFLHAGRRATDGAVAARYIDRHVGAARASAEAILARLPSRGTP